MAPDPLAERVQSEELQKVQVVCAVVMVALGMGFGRYLFSLGCCRYIDTDCQRLAFRLQERFKRPPFSNNVHTRVFESDLLFILDDLENVGRWSIFRECRLKDIRTRLETLNGKFDELDIKSMTTSARAPLKSM